MTTLPTMSELIGLDKFNLTESQNQQCRMLANHRGSEAAIEQAKKFSSNPDVIKSVCEHEWQPKWDSEGNEYAECLKCKMKA